MSAAPSTSTADLGDQDSHPVGSKEDMTFQQRIQWLDQVTSHITDELDVVHPPPLRNVLAKATSSEMVQELRGVGKVFGSVASDLKEGFVGLEETIESLAKGDDRSSVKAPADAGPGDTVPTVEP